MQPLQSGDKLKGVNEVISSQAADDRLTVSGHLAQRSLIWSGRTATPPARLHKCNRLKAGGRGVSSGLQTSNKKKQVSSRAEQVSHLDR